MQRQLASPVVVVGTAAAGLKAAEHLLSSRWGGPLTIIGAESEELCSRPPLPAEPRHIRSVDMAARHSATLLRRRRLDGRVRWHRNTSVVRADLAAKTLELNDGTTMEYAGLMIATGLRPRRLPDISLPDIRYAIRTVDDIARLRCQLSPGTRVVIVGAGFLGCELALSASARGCHVTVVETHVAPMSEAVGVYVGNAIRRHHAYRGVHIATGVDVVGIAPGTTTPAIVSLSDDTDLPADVIVECLGSQPNVEWLEGNGLDLSDGVLCHHDLSVVGTSGAVAVGEVARFPNSRFGGSAVRVENWRAPTENAGYAARTLLAGLNGHRKPRSAFAPLPRCWSKQGDLRLDVYGMPSLGDRKKIVHGDLTGGPIAGSVVVEYFRGTDPVGVVALNTPQAEQAPYRNALAAATDGAARTVIGVC